jgi:hypothetical protein
MFSEIKCEVIISCRFKFQYLIGTVRNQISKGQQHAAPEVLISIPHRYGAEPEYVKAVTTDAAASVDFNTS